MRSFEDVSRHSDMREIVAGLWNDIAAARMRRYLSRDSPDFMVNDVKTGAERAWRSCHLVQAGSRMESACTGAGLENLTLFDHPLTGQSRTCP